MAASASAASVATEASSGMYSAARSRWRARSSGWLTNLAARRCKSPLTLRGRVSYATSRISGSVAS